MHICEQEVGYIYTALSIKEAINICRKLLGNLLP